MAEEDQEPLVSGCGSRLWAAGHGKCVPAERTGCCPGCASCVWVCVYVHQLCRAWVCEREGDNRVQGVWAVFVSPAVGGSGRGDVWPALERDAGCVCRVCTLCTLTGCGGCVCRAPIAHRVCAGSEVGGRLGERQGWGLTPGTCLPVVLATLAEGLGPSLSLCASCWLGMAPGPRSVSVDVSGRPWQDLGSALPLVPLGPESPDGGKPGPRAFPEAGSASQKW